MSLGDEVQAIANRSFGEGLQKTTRQRRRYHRRQSLDGIRLVGALGISQNKGSHAETSHGINLGQGKRRQRDDGHVATMDLRDAKFSMLPLKLLHLIADDSLQSPASSQMNP